MAIEEHKADKKTWQEIKARCISTMSRDDFLLMCELHSKHLKHRYHEPCTCNKRTLRKWIADLDKRLLN